MAGRRDAESGVEMIRMDVEIHNARNYLSRWPRRITRKIYSELIGYSIKLAMTNYVSRSLSHLYTIEKSLLPSF
jgi:hypothetical protein